MAYSGKTIAAAKAVLADRVSVRQAQADRRLAEVYQKLPQVRRIDSELRSQMMELAMAVFQKDNSDDLEKMAARNLKLQSQREELLASAGFPADYTDDKPICPECEDRGFVGSRMCTCLAELCARQQIKELSALLKLGNESFDNFRIDYYSARTSPDYGVSPRENMEMVYEQCVYYARNFGKNSGNICFRGGTGLGKTFLAACIAREVSNGGNSVVYDTAINILDAFERVKFGNDTEEAEEYTQQVLNCDLLILDDLGTEMKTQFTVSALYNIINTRLMKDRKTLLTTNLTLNEMKERYTPQIMSRIEGEYTTLFFFGDDIRIMKNSQI